MTVFSGGESPLNVFTTTSINCRSWSYGSISAGMFSMWWFPDGVLVLFLLFFYFILTMTSKVKGFLKNIYYRRIWTIVSLPYFFNLGMSDATDLFYNQTIHFFVWLGHLSMFMGGFVYHTTSHADWTRVNVIIGVIAESASLPSCYRCVALWVGAAFVKLKFYFDELHMAAVWAQ